MRLGLGLAMLVACLPLTGCGDDDGGSDAGAGDAGEPDAMVTDASRIPDGARLCETDADCDDGVGCTRDICDPLGYCRNPVDIAMCDDGVFCNGVEQCDPVRGCVPGPPETCNDSDVCTLDSCDEAGKTCRHAALDFDGDGEVDWHCDDSSGEPGTDCNDRDATVGSLLTEVCEDLVDNDCDGSTDEADCGVAPHDTCDDALDVSAGGSFMVTTSGARADYSTTCGSSTYRDVVLSLTLTEPKDVTITADGTSGSVVAIRTDCADRATELECQSWFPGQVRARALGAGTYFVIVKDWSVGEMWVDVDLSAPTEAPTNETCASPIDVSAGGSFAGTTVDVGDDMSTSCGSGPDLVYSFTTTATQNVYIGLLSSTGDTTMSFSVRSSCADSASELRCQSGTVAYTTLYSLPAGTYYIVAEGPSYREVDFTLEVRFNPPTSPPPGDSCADPIVLPLDTMTLGTLADKQEDYSLSCGGSSYQDAVYEFTLPARKDVNVVVDGGTTYMYASVRTSCADGSTASQLRCTPGSPARSTLRDLPAGTYYVIVESYRGTGFNISIETSPPTTAIPVSGNENCATAYLVPLTGGLFSGNTTGMTNDYGTSTCGVGASAGDAAFRLDLPATKRVIASTSGSAYDTVLHVHESMCVSGGELYCDDDGADGVTSLIDQTLSAGTWYFIVDGWGSYTGAYYFQVMVSDP